MLMIYITIKFLAILVVFFFPTSDFVRDFFFYFLLGYQQSCLEFSDKISVSCFPLFPLQGPHPESIDSARKARVWRVVSTRVGQGLGPGLCVYVCVEKGMRLGARTCCP